MSTPNPQPELRMRPRHPLAVGLLATLLVPLAACGPAGSPEEETGEQSGALSSAPVTVVAFSEATRIELDPDASGPIETVAGEPGGLRLVDTFTTLPSSVVLDVGDGGRATVTLLPGGQRLVSAAGEVTLPVNTAGTCAQVEVQTGELTARWNVVVKRAGSTAPCESSLSDTGSFTSFNDPEARTMCWRAYRHKKGWFTKCITWLPGIP